MITGAVLIYARTRGFQVLAEEIGKLSTTGSVILVVSIVAAVLAGLTESRWYPKLLRHLAGRNHSHIVSISAASLGLPVVATVILLLFPLLSLFSSSGNAWIYFSIFGWGGALLMWYYLIGIYKKTTAIMYADGEWWISRAGGLFGWRTANSYRDLSATEEPMAGWSAYVLTYRVPEGYHKTIGYLPKYGFTAFDRENITRFLDSLSHDIKP